MSKYTPGPWVAEDRGAYGDFDGRSRVITGDDRRIAIVQHKGDQEDEANAVLIAVAPEMLNALKHARDCLGHPDELIDNVLAKAEEEGD